MLDLNCLSPRSHGFSSAMCPGWDSALSFLLPLFLSVGLLFLAIGVAAYVLNAVGLYTMAKKRGIESPWLAWLPVGNQYILGALIGDRVTIGSCTILYARIFLPLLSVLFAWLVGIPAMLSGSGIFVIILVAVFVTIYQYASQYNLYRIYDADHRIIYLVLSLIFPLAMPIFVYYLRHREADTDYLEVIKPQEYDDKGILALCLGLFSLVSILGGMGDNVFIAILGIVFAILAIKQAKLLAKPRGRAIIGLVCSISSLALTFMLMMGALLFASLFFGF